MSELSLDTSTPWRRCCVRELRHLYRDGTPTLTDGDTVWCFGCATELEYRDGAWHALTHEQMAAKLAAERRA